MHLPAEEEVKNIPGTMACGQDHMRGCDMVLSVDLEAGELVADRAEERGRLAAIDPLGIGPSTAAMEYFRKYPSPNDPGRDGRARLKGLVVAEASATSHVAIVARALGVPLVAGIDSALGLAEAGDDVIIDGETGEVLIRPTVDVVASYREKEALQSEQQAAFAAERHLPAVTTDGVSVELYMNAGIPLDMTHLERTGAAGVGLFRTELQFIIGAQLPRAGAQEKLYAQILALAGDKPVVFRTADLGADKAGAYMKVRPEANPAMGWRGLRMAIDRPGLFRPQLRALLSASAGRTAQILFPMITVPEEIDAARDLIAREIDFATRRGRALPAEIRIGAMIETPAAAWRIDDIAARVDFLSIGGNDLAQFYFAADRDAEMTQRRFDALDPGFLSFVARLAAAAARAGKSLTFCGEQAADPLMAAALVGAGVRRFSAPASAIGPFRRLVRSLDAAALADWIDSRDFGAATMRRGLAAYLSRSAAAA